MSRRVLALGLLAALVALAGCSALGPGQPDPEELSGNATYDWDSDANVTYNVTKGEFQTIVSVTNRSEVRVYHRDEIGSENPLDVAALKFRYTNGTVVDVVNASEFYVNRTRQRTIITLPEREGQVAFTSPRTRSKRFSTPMFVEGSHEVRLPERARVGIPLLSQVSPGEYDKRVEDGRQVIEWDNVERGPIVARYYLQRDLLLFGGLAAILVFAGVAGTLYYVRQIKLLERRREEIGLDVEMEDDDIDDRGPPPGMR